MRYIRTKDGKIINIDKYKIIKRMCDGVYYRNSDKEIWRVIYTEDIKAEADTIEELCDGWITIDKETSEPVILTPLSYWTFKEAKEHAEEEETTLYGAIWTDKGLIYVAKMNEKRRIELL